MTYITGVKNTINPKNKAHENQVTQTGNIEPCQNVGTSYPTSCMNICFSKSEANTQISNNLPLWLKQTDANKTRREIPPYFLSF